MQAVKWAERIQPFFDAWREPSPVAARHDHWVRWGSLLRVSAFGGEIPLNVEVIGDFPRGLKKADPLDLELRLYFIKGEFFCDETEYVREKKSHMAAESIIPCGTFSPTCDPSFIESAAVLLNGTVLSARPFSIDGEKMYAIDLRLWENVLRVVSVDGYGESGVHEGNILSGHFGVSGKVKRRGEP